MTRFLLSYAMYLVVGLDKILKPFRARREKKRAAHKARMAQNLAGHMAQVEKDRQHARDYYSSFGQMPYMAMSGIVNVNALHDAWDKKKKKKKKRKKKKGKRVDR